MFDVNAYLARRADLRANWEASTADYAAIYGTLENYALADAAAHGTEEEKAFIRNNQIVVPQGFQVQGTTVTPGQGVPYEQHLFNQILRDYINPDLAGDATRRAQATQITGNINRSIDGAIAINNELLTGTFDAQGYLRANPDVAAQAQRDVAEGRYPDIATAAKAHYDAYGRAEGRQANFITRLQQENQFADETAARLRASAAEAAATRLASLDQRKAEMTASLERMQGDRTGALDAQTAQLRAGLAQLETERQAALQQLTTARIEAAEGQVTGINQGLQSERDRLTAQQAAQGFVGGSSMDNAAMARATIGARQAAAETMGAARVANAGDSRALGDEIANTRFAITGNDATARRGIAEDTARGRFNLDDSISQGRVSVADRQATDTQAGTNVGTQMRVAYFDNDINRRREAALFPIALEGQRIALLDGADRAGQSGLNRTLSTLNWFANGTTPPTSNPGTTTPSTTGSDIAALGAGLVRGGFSAGNSVGWGNLFSRPRASTPDPSALENNPD